MIIRHATTTKIIAYNELGKQNINKNKTNKKIATSEFKI